MLINDTGALELLGDSERHATPKELLAAVLAALVITVIAIASGSGQPTDHPDPTVAVSLARK